MNVRTLIIVAFVPVVAFAAPDPFASFVVSASGLGSDPWFNDPQAMLGPPTIENRDTVNGGSGQAVVSSVVYAPWRQTSDGAKALCTIPSGGQVTIGFQEPILNDPLNWNGLDFIVFGNSFFLNSVGTITASTNLSAVTIPSASLFNEPVTVSVSPDLLQWYTYTSPVADSLWPTQGRQWLGSSWGKTHLYDKPVPPSLNAAQVAGKTVAEVIRMYDRSAGGTGFDLAPSGFTAIRYVRFQSNGGEIDAVSRVGHAKERGSINIINPGARLR